MNALSSLGLRFGKSAALGSIFIGFLVAFFMPIIAQNINVRLPYEQFFIFVFPVLSLVGLYAAYFLNRFIPFAYQAAKFALVGFLNTAIDFGVANFLIFVTGIAAGWQVSAFKTISFIVAIINSYLWNKYWTFGRGKAGGVHEFSQFFTVSVIGLGVNISATSIIIGAFQPVGGLSAAQWANAAFVAATVCSLVWNFIGYKFWVFKAGSSGA